MAAFYLFHIFMQDTNASHNNVTIIGYQKVQVIAGIFEGGIISNIYSTIFFFYICSTMSRREGHAHFIIALQILRNIETALFSKKKD